jgi:hypothetical protein
MGGPKEYKAHAATCLWRARTVRNPILAKEFEKLAQSWLRLAKAAEESGLTVQRSDQRRRGKSAPRG